MKKGKVLNISLRENGTQICTLSTGEVAFGNKNVPNIEKGNWVTFQTSPKTLKRVRVIAEDGTVSYPNGPDGKPLLEKDEQGGFVNQVTAKFADRAEIENTFAEVASIDANVQVRAEAMASRLQLELATI